MEKVLKKNIIALVFFAITLVLGITIGVMAVSNSSKSIEFNLGVQYKADLEISILAGDKKIFDSSAPASIDSTYFHSIGGDTMILNEETFTFDANNKLTLTFANNNSDKHIRVTVNSDTTNAKVIEAGKTDTYDIQKSSTGRTLVNLLIEEVYIVTFNLMYDDKIETKAISPSDEEIYTPTRENYDFQGWFRESTYENQVTDFSTITQSITLYAKWLSKQLTITVNYSSANASDSLSAVSKPPEIVGAVTGFGFYVYITIDGVTEKLRQNCELDDAADDVTQKIFYFNSGDKIIIRCSFDTTYYTLNSFSVAGGLVTEDFNVPAVSQGYKSITMKESEGKVVTQNVVINWHD